MKKRIIASITALSLVCGVCFACIEAFADNIRWEYDSLTKTLTISGNGSMDNYDEYSMPWYDYISQIESVVVSEGIDYIGNYSFSNAARLSNVVLPSTLEGVGEYAFSSCSSLDELYLPHTVKSIADSSFAYDGLVEKASFSLRCDAGSYALYYAIKNSVNFDCDSVKCDTFDVDISSGGMTAYYPYTARVNGTFRVYSTGRHDTYGYLYDSDMRVVKSNDDENDYNTNFSITCNLTKGETYYFAARIYNSALTGHFNLVFEPVSYSVSGRVCAMANPQGQPSDILIDDAIIDSVQTDGEFAYDITTPKTIEIIADGKTITHTFTPDDGDEVAITVMVCDVNDDGIVNVQDLAIMQKTGEKQKYISLFDNFINYTY